jgi:hypothetical protein
LRNRSFSAALRRWRHALADVIFVAAFLPSTAWINRAAALVLGAQCEEHLPAEKMMGCVYRVGGLERLGWWEAVVGLVLLRRVRIAVGFGVAWVEDATRGGLMGGRRGMMWVGLRVCWAEEVCARRRQGILGFM